MEIIWILATLVIGVVIARLVLREQPNKQSSTASATLNEKTPSILNGNIDTYYIGDKCISLYARKGYSGFPIAGAYYQNLPISIVGKFNGYATTEPYNDHDKYAIAIYTDAGIQLGYIPKNNRKLHAYIMDNNDSVHAYGYIGCNDDGGMYGEVCVETDKTIVTTRNKPYNVG